MTQATLRGLNTRAVATTLNDLRDQLAYELTPLRHVVGAYLTVKFDPPKVHVWTLLDERDEHTEDVVARAEHRLMETFHGVNFDFTGIHLRGRDPEQFIPEGAYPVKIAHQRVMRFFQEALLSRTNAGT